MQPAKLNKLLCVERAAGSALQFLVLRPALLIFPVSSFLGLLSCDAPPLEREVFYFRGYYTTHAVMKS